MKVKSDKYETKHVQENGVLVSKLVLKKQIPFTTVIEDQCLECGIRLAHEYLINIPLVCGKTAWRMLDDKYLEVCSVDFNSNIHIAILKELNPTNEDGDYYELIEILAS